MAGANRSQARRFTADWARSVAACVFAVGTSAGLLWLLWVLPRPWHPRTMSLILGVPLTCPIAAGWIIGLVDRRRPLVTAVASAAVGQAWRGVRMGG